MSSAPGCLGTRDTLHHSQEESELSLGCSLASDTELPSSRVDLGCSLATSDSDIVDCSISDSPIDLVDCTITNTSFTLADTGQGTNGCLTGLAEN